MIQASAAHRPRPYLQVSWDGVSCTHSESRISRMKRASIRQSADTLASVLDEVQAGELDASPEQVAYLTGALDTLKSLLGE